VVRTPIKTPIKIGQILFRYRLFWGPFASDKEKSLFKTVVVRHLVRWQAAAKFLIILVNGRNT